MLELNPGDTRAEKIKEIAKKYARRWIMAYRYMLSYYAYVKSDYTTATAYAEKMLEIDPVNEIAAKFLAATSKRGGRRR